MSEYTEIYGQAIRQLDADPSPLINGEVYYRTDTQQYKIVVNCSAEVIDVTGV